MESLKISHSFSTGGLAMDEPVTMTHKLIDTGYYTDTANMEDWLPTGLDSGVIVRKM